MAAHTRANGDRNDSLPPSQAAWDSARSGSLSHFNVLKLSLTGPRWFGPAHGEKRMTTYQEINTAARSTQDDIKVRYTAKTHTSGGRRGGVSRSDDGRLDVEFSAPGAPGTGTNPEQLFAAGWSACFISAMGVVANKMKVKLPADAAVDAEIDLCNSGDVYFLRARLNVSLPGLEREIAQAIVNATHGETCAYSNATRSNVDVTVSVV
jgi:lipoyl-dependent peroxiredoxin